VASAPDSLTAVCPVEKRREEERQSENCFNMANVYRLLRKIPYIHNW